MDENVTVYLPDNSVRQGYRSIFRDMAREVREGRWLTWQLFKRDFKAVYKQSVLGFLWVLIFPVVTLATFVLLTYAGKFVPGEINVWYPIFALLGISFWQLFAVGLQSTTNSVTAAGSLIAKIKFPREALVFSAMGQAFVGFIIQIVLVVVLVFYNNLYLAGVEGTQDVFVPAWTTFLAPLAIIPLALLALGLGFILSLANGVVRDIGKGIGVITTFLMFVTPVLYVTPTEGLLGTLTMYNPLFYLTAVPRDLILTGEFLYPTEYMLSVLLAVGCFFGFWIIFHLTETRIAERI
jgi:lipopolysaccharide transport system permease protein